MYVSHHGTHASRACYSRSSRTRAQKLEGIIVLTAHKRANQREKMQSYGSWRSCWPSNTSLKKPSTHLHTMSLDLLRDRLYTVARHCLYYTVACHRCMSV